MRYLALLCLLTLTAAAAAQRPSRVTSEIRQEISSEDSLFMARLNLARSLTGGGQIDRGIAVLEDLHRERPADVVVFETLLGAYESVKRYEEALTMIGAAIARRPRGADPDLRAEMARLYYLSGQEQGALGAWHSILDATEDLERHHRLVYESMMRVRLIDKAITVLERGRARTGRPELFQTELAYLHGLVGAHDKAMEEYLDLLQANERQLNYVRGRLSQSLQQQDALETSLPIVADRVQQYPGHRSYRELYAWMLVEHGDFERAFEEHRLLSRDEINEGRALFDFASQVADLGAYDIAAAAFNEVLTKHPAALIAAEALLGMAEMHQRHARQLVDEGDRDQGLPFYSAALASYEAFLEQFPGHPQVPEALRRMGALQHTEFYNYEEARTTLTEVAQSYDGSPAALQARFDLGRLEVDQSNLMEARKIFESLETQLSPHHVLAEKSRYERALIEFYVGNLSNAANLVESIRQHSDSEVANEALALKLLILENPGPDEINLGVQQYAGVASFIRQRRYEEAIILSDTLLYNWSQHPIADDARFLRAQALHGASRLDDALLAYGELSLIHPDSPLADHALFEYASLLDRELGQESEAIEAYSSLLERFPGSVLAPKVRARIRELRLAEV